MTLDKCIVLRIGTLTGCPLCRESHPLCRLKNPTVIPIWLLVGFHPATRSVQSTPADNTRKRVWQYIEKERRVAPHWHSQGRSMDHTMHLTYVSFSYLSKVNLGGKAVYWTCTLSQDSCSLMSQCITPTFSPYFCLAHIFKQACVMCKENAKYRGTYAQIFAPPPPPKPLNYVDGAYHDGLHISTKNYT